MEERGESRAHTGRSNPAELHRRYPVMEVSQRLGVSPHSLYAWKRQFAKVMSGGAGKEAEIRQLKRYFARVNEERDIP